MAEQKEDSFQKMNRKEKAGTIIGVTILIVLVGGFIFGAFFLGFAGIFELLGVQYDSIWSLVLFVISFFVLGILVDLFFDAVATLMVEHVHGNVLSFLIQFLFGFISNLLVLLIVDAFMDSITLSLETIYIVALLLGVLDPVFDNKKKKRGNS